MIRVDRWLALAAIAVFSVAASAVARQAPVAAAPRETLGFEEQAPAAAGWFVPTPGWTAELVEMPTLAGAKAVRFALTGEAKAPMGNLMRTLNAEPYRGTRLRLGSKVRIEGDGRVQMWMRVDRVGGATGAFDNMGNRPLTRGFGGWTSASIELDVDNDAASLAFGFMVFGSSTVAFIDDVVVEAVGAAAPMQEATQPMPLTPRGLANLRAATKLLSYVRFFHPSDQAVGVASWDHVALALVEAAEPATDAADLARRLREVIAPIAPTVEIWAGGVDAAPAPAAAPAEATSVRSWTHRGAGTLSKRSGMNIYSSSVDAAAFKPGDAASSVTKPLDGGVSCRIPVRVFADAQGTLPHGETPETLRKDATRVRLVDTNRATRLAGVALAWGVFQHFFPYFAPDGELTQEAWEAALSAALEKAAADATSEAYAATLATLVAALHDGHGAVMGGSATPRTMLPFLFEWAGDDLVVVGLAPNAPSEVRVGDVVVAIDGKPIAECEAEVSKRISAATLGWRRFVSASAIASFGAAGDQARMQLRSPDGAEYSLAVNKVPNQQIQGGAAKRPANGSEVAPGVVYFNLDRADAAALAAAMPKLESAKGLVFDLRGYPDQAAYELIQHLVDEPATSARWMVPLVTKPDREGWTWIESGRWQMPPLKPRLHAPVAFVTDGRAISYAESIMGIVEAYKLGEIVGSTTAGTNGNVNPFELPGGYGVSWTGMRVMKHDGTRHHGVGIAPTVPVTPTAKGIAAGRDEVLEKAIEVVKRKGDGG